MSLKSELENGRDAASSTETLIAEGNSRFVDEDWEGALDCFTRANDASTYHSAQALSRRAAVHLRLHNFEDAVADANKAIDADPNLAISYLRKGVACFELDEHESALAAFQAGARLEPNNQNLKKWLRKAHAELESGEGTPCNSGTTAEDCTGTGVVITLEQKQEHESTLTISPGVIQGAPATLLTHSTTPSSPAPSTPKYRHEWYQSASQVVVTIFAKGLKPSEVNVEFGEQMLCVSIQNAGEQDPFVLLLGLFGKIDPAHSKHVVLSTKVEVRLAKAEAIHWSGLEATARAVVAALQPINVSTDVSNLKSSYPSSSQKKKDWSKIEQEVTTEENDDMIHGDGVDKFFQSLYKDADEETRRAMNKSFVESKGTVLSTDWNNVSKKKVEADGF